MGYCLSVADTFSKIGCGYCYVPMPMHLFHFFVCMYVSQALINWLYVGLFLTNACMREQMKHVLLGFSFSLCPIKSTPRIMVMPTALALSTLVFAASKASAFNRNRQGLMGVRVKFVFSSAFWNVSLFFIVSHRGEGTLVLSVETFLWWAQYLVICQLICWRQWNFLSWPIFSFLERLFVFPASKPFLIVCSNCLLIDRLEGCYLLDMLVWYLCIWTISNLLGKAACRGIRGNSKEHFLWHTQQAVNLYAKILFTSYRGQCIVLPAPAKHTRNYGMFFGLIFSSRGNSICYHFFRQEIITDLWFDYLYTLGMVVTKSQEKLIFLSVSVVCSC